jgi:aspartyl protease family protein
MAVSRSGQTLIGDLLGWAVALGVGAFAIVFSSELKSGGYALFGMTPPDTGQPRMSVATAPTRSGSAGRGAATGAVELRVGANGHFFSDADVNGRRIETMVDTGASVIALTYEDARTIGLAPSPQDFTHQVSTANGIAKVAPVSLDRVQIGDITIRNVNAVIVERGKLTMTLLGNSFLSRLSRYEMRSGRMVLEE